MELLQVNQLSFTYPTESTPALHDLSFTLNDGEFVLLMGESGCGKTTLLRLLKREIAPYGNQSGKIVYDGHSLEQKNDSPVAVGFVGQNPDEQIVTDKVWHELAFGLENLGVDRETIRCRVGEMAHFFGIQNWYRQSTDSLSGGQKQILNLASVMVMQPKLLLLDEPTAQLDPIAATEFIGILQKLNRELGLTIFLTEHRLEEVYPLCDKVMVMEEGRLITVGAPDQVCEALRGHRLFAGLPSAARIWDGLNGELKCPLTVKEGREFLNRRYPDIRHPCRAGESAPVSTKTTPPALEAKGVWFRYEKSAPDVLKNFQIRVDVGECFCVLGGNGSGKTTMLQVLSGLERPYRGERRVFGAKTESYPSNSLYRHTLALLPQNPKALLIHPTVEEDFREILTALEVKKAEQEEQICTVAEELGMTHLLRKHPYDISGGELQKCAIAKLLLTRPRILLLDEPTKGLDAYTKRQLGQTLKSLQRNGLTLLLVTHDVEFAAEVSDRCGLFFDGGLLSVGTPATFFAENNFYTTAASRIARNQFPCAVLCEQVIRAAKECEPY